MLWDSPPNFLVPNHHTILYWGNNRILFYYYYYYFFWWSLWFRDILRGNGGYSLIHMHYLILLPFVLLVLFLRESQIYSFGAELWSHWLKSWWLIYSWVLGPLAVIYPMTPKFSPRVLIYRFSVRKKLHSSQSTAITHDFISYALFPQHHYV